MATSPARALPEVSVRSVDVDEAREVGSRDYHRHRVTVLGDAKDLASDDALIRQPMVAAPFAHSVMTGLLLAARHDNRDEMAAPVAAVGAPTVRTAQAFIEANADQPLTVIDIARAAGVGVRGLQQGFQRALDMTPMQYLRQVRLRQAHLELRGADAATTTVGQVAARWGFRHQGRFAAEYRRRSGVAPTETLRQRH